MKITREIVQGFHEPHMLTLWEELEASFALRADSEEDRADIGGVTCMFGPVGSGKTLVATYICREYRAHGYHAYSDNVLLFGEHRRTESLLCNIDEVRPRSVVLVDEAASLFSESAPSMGEPEMGDIVAFALENDVRLIITVAAGGRPPRLVTGPIRYPIFDRGPKPRHDVYFPELIDVRTEKAYTRHPSWCHVTLRIRSGGIDSLVGGQESAFAWWDRPLDPRELWRASHLVNLRDGVAKLPLSGPGGAEEDTFTYCDRLRAANKRAGGKDALGYARVRRLSAMPW